MCCARRKSAHTQIAQLSGVQVKNIFVGNRGDGNCDRREKAIAELNGTQLEGCTLNASEMRPRPERAVVVEEAGRDAEAVGAGRRIF